MIVLNHILLVNGTNFLKRLEQSFENLGLFSSDEQVWSKEPNLKEILRLKKISKSRQVGIEIEQLQSQGINITTWAEETYPKRLKEVVKEKFSMFYYCGIGPFKTNCRYSRVKNIDENGLNYTKKFVTRCVKEELTIVWSAKGDIIVRNSTN